MTTGTGEVAVVEDGSSLPEAWDRELQIGVVATSWKTTAAALFDWSLAARRDTGCRPLLDREQKHDKQATCSEFPSSFCFVRLVASTLTFDQRPENQPYPPQRVAGFAAVVILSAITDLRHCADEVGQFFLHFVAQVRCCEVEAVGDSPYEGRKNTLVKPRQSGCRNKEGFKREAR